MYELDALRQRVADLEQQLAVHAPAANPRHLHEDLHRSEERFRALVETVVVPTWIHRSGWFVYVNPATEKLLGYSSAQLLTMQVWDIMHPDFVEMVKARAMARQQGEGPPPAYEIKIVTSSGAERWVELNAGRITYDGEPGILVTFLDVTARKDKEEALQASEARFRGLLEQTGVATLIHDKGRLLYMNPAAQDVTGYGPQELHDIFLNDLIHPDSLAAVQQHMLARMHGDTTPNRYEIQIVRKDGDVRWLEIEAAVIEFEGEGSILVTGMDITTRKQAEEEQARLQAAIIDAQRMALRALSTPLIPISAQVVVMPLIGQIDQGRAEQIMEELLAGIAEHRAHTAILDITGVPGMDEQVALALVQAAQAARLLGTRVILTGVRPDVAQRLVVLHMPLADIPTCGTLQAGIAQALGRAGQT
jgi:PAS domain S-box-containing protein